MFRGSITALVTPFRNEKVDDEAFAAFIDWQIDQGTHGLVVAGTTGESPTLSHEEHQHVIALCVKQAAGRVPVLAGTGSNNTQEAIDLSRYAEKAGASGLLVVTPYYNKPTQEGMYRHFKALNDAVGLPIILYNIPSRCVVDLSVETMARLYELKNIVGVKDATARLDRASLQRQKLGPDFIQLSGDDATALGFMAHGGQGCISVTSNVAPQLCAEFQEQCLKGAFDKARVLHDRLMPLHTDLFVETNPSPVKYALSMQEKMRPDVRLPLIPLGEDSQKTVDAAMRHAGVI